jgi:lipopolysaccharide heptosyltransferase I
VNRLLLVRLGSLGDVIHAVPAAAALRAAFPDVRIDWVTDPRYVAVLDLVEGLDRRIALDTRALMSGPHSALGVLARLRHEHYDAVLDLQGLVKSAALARAASGRRTIGMSRQDLREPAAGLLYTESVDVSSAAHVIYKGLGLLRALDVEDTTIRFPLRVPVVDAIESLARRGGAAGFVLLNPGAAWPNKRWPVANFGALAARLLATFGMRSTVMWGPGEQDLAAGVAAASGGAADIGPATTVTDIFALARAARLMISGDTGPMHIAAAVGTPIVGLFGPTRSERNGPWSPDDVTISRMASCECAYQRTCRRNQMCIADISVEDVVHAAERRLERARQRV